MIKCVIKFLFNVILKNYANKQQFKINPIYHITGLRNKKTLLMKFTQVQCILAKLILNCAAEKVSLHLNKKIYIYKAFED